MNDLPVGNTENVENTNNRGKLSDDQKNMRLKMIEALLSKNGQILNGARIPEVSEEEEERFFRMVSSGALSKKDFENIIGEANTPEIMQIFSVIDRDKFKRRILAYMTGAGFDNYQAVNSDSVVKFLRKFPRPDDFSSAKNDFLGAIHRSNPQKKYDEYSKEMEEFVEIVYGDRWLYTVVAEDLKQEAENWQLEQDAVKLKAAFLDRAVVEGDPWIQQGLAYQLKPEYLEQKGLAPMFLIEMGGVKIAFSKVFMVDTHEAVIAYVDFNSSVKVRGYYRSNSQGMWRYLPDYVGGNGEIVWYGVGFNEESLTLPLKIQQHLNEIARKHKIELKDVNAGYFLGASAKRYNSKEEYQQKRAAGQMEGAYYREVSAVPKIDFGVLSARKHPPQSVDVRGDAGPDFRQLINSYQMETRMYGKVTVRQFPSHDDVLRYSVCEIGDSGNKRAWIGNMEVNAPITSTGLKREWVSTGDICTPLFEYQSMTGGFGTDVGRTDGYMSMWEKYLRLTPIIKDYLFEWH